MAVDPISLAKENTRQIELLASALRDMRNMLLDNNTLYIEQFDTLNRRIKVLEAKTERKTSDQREW